MNKVLAVIWTMIGMIVLIDALRDFAATIASSHFFTNELPFMLLLSLGAMISAWSIAYLIWRKNRESTFLTTAASIFFLYGLFVLLLGGMGMAPWLWISQSAVLLVLPAATLMWSTHS